MKQVLATVVAFVLIGSWQVGAQVGDLHVTSVSAMRKAAEFYHGKVANHGGYVYHYSLDLKIRWGEGLATADQIWVQPPATPTVGLAFLRAYQATGDQFYLTAATDAAEALVYGQLKSGGWTNSVDFNPRGEVALYRNGKGGGKNNSSLDDGQSQSAIRFLINVDQALEFKHAKIHESAVYALDALLAAQFPNGGFPQVWTGPVKPQPIKQASYPNHDWKTEGRIKNYWEMYTLNDDVCGYVAATLIDAHKIYADKKCEAALRRLGDFLVLAQMPEPQPGWAQQYNYDMQPIWARKFEPAAVSADESQEVIATLCAIFEQTGDAKYLKPIPAAIEYLQRSLLPDGRLARYYELKTNKPLYMERAGQDYALTYDDSKLPSHYGWKSESRLTELKRRNERLSVKQPASMSTPVSQTDVQRAIDGLDEQGRWVSTYQGELLVGQPKFETGAKYISSEVFSRNLVLISEYLRANRRN